MFEALADGTIASTTTAQVVSDAEVEEGVAAGRLVVDTRLRDALRRIDEGERNLTFPTPTLVDEATYAVEAAVARRGGRGAAAAPSRHARAAARDRRAGLPNRVYRKLVGPAGAFSSQLALHRADADDDLVQRVVGVELLRPQVGRRQPVQESRRGQDVAEGHDLDVPRAERLLREPPRRAARVVPPLAELRVLERRDPREPGTVASRMPPGRRMRCSVARAARTS